MQKQRNKQKINSTKANSYKKRSVGWYYLTRDLSWLLFRVYFNPVSSWFNTLTSGHFPKQLHPLSGPPGGRRSVGPQG